MHRIPVSSLDNGSLLSQYRTALCTRDAMFNCEENEMLLDLSSAEWFAPTFLTPISVAYNRLVSDGKDIQIQYPRQQGAKAYLDQIHFPEGVAEPTDKHDNHLPLCLMNTDSNRDVVEIVGRKIRELVRKQFSSLSKSGVMWITYPLNEIIDNVDYHSQCDFGALLIQRYPSKEQIDICIADDGISIPGSFDTYDVDYDSDEDAVRQALQEGISTRRDTGYERGYGLRTTAEMVCDGINGQIMLSSREATLYRDGHSGPHCRLNDNHWNGTVFTARLNVPDDDFDYKDYIY
jgi:hypothetical protein